MDYIVKDTITETRYNATLSFTEEIGDIFRAGNFSITLIDTVTLDSFVIDGNNYTEYGITAPFTTKEQQIEDSLVNNGGLIIYLNKENEISIIAIPKCSCGDKTIGFFTLRATLIFPSLDYKTSFLIKLCPYIIRDEKPKQLIDSYDDPILPLRNDRVCKDFTPGYIINAPSTNIKYNDTINALYVNTKTSGDYGYSTDLVDPDYGRVPCYINHLKVMSIPYEYDEEYDFKYDWDTVKSYLYDDVANTKINIDYDVSQVNINPTPTTIVSSNGEDYKCTLQYYDVNQFICYNIDGSFRNRLVFEVSQWEKLPVDKPSKLTIEVYADLIDIDGDDEGDTPWPMENGVYILDDDNPTWHGFVKVKNKNKPYFEVKPDVIWNPEVEPYKEIGPIDEQGRDIYYETRYYLSGISADRDGTVNTINIESYLNIENDPDFTPEQIKNYTETNNTIKVKYEKPIIEYALGDNDEFIGFDNLLIQVH